MNITVIIPVYNAEKFIRKAVHSADSIEMVKEILLIEDGSIDGSLKVCEELEEELSKVKLFTHPNNVNKGAGATRNLGLQKATQPYISFLDSDDYFLKDRFKLDMSIFA